MDATTLLLIGLGGALGSLGRYGLGLTMAPISQSLPWGTIVINILGSFAIGAFSALTAAQGRFPASDNVRLFVMVGLCGGFTTFSSFSLQTFDLLRGGAWGRALANVALSVVVCVVALALGYGLGAQLSGASPMLAQSAAEDEA